MNRAILLSKEAASNASSFLEFTLVGIEIHFSLDGVQVVLLPL
jgi:hypothetical protein